MASAAEQLAANINFGAFAKATELASASVHAGCLIVFRLGTYHPAAGHRRRSIIQTRSSQHSGGVLGMLNMFAGGAVERMTIFALSIMPYISASIIIQLMTGISPTLEALKKEGRGGPQEDQPVHALSHRAARDVPVLRRGPTAWLGCPWRVGDRRSVLVPASPRSSS